MTTADFPGGTANIPDGNTLAPDGNTLAPDGNTLAPDGNTLAPGGNTLAPGGTAKLAGRRVARIGFGAMQLERRTVGRDAALAVLRQAVDAGVNHIDTAQFYGACNAYIRDALAPYPDDLVLVTKVGAERDAGGALVPA